MKIVADSNLALIEQDIPAGVELLRVDGRNIRNEHVRDADVLLVRSVTRVDADLLQGSRVRFVGTATAGLDHLDTDFLQKSAVSYCSAPGCNADAVVDYCLAALAYARLELDVNVESAAIGIVGVGNVGGRLCNRLRDLGCSVLLNDPPLQDAGKTSFAGLPLLPLDQLAGCQVISLHVPYSIQGQHPTRDLIGKDFLATLPDGCLLINTCRGEVVEEGALQELSRKPRAHSIIDVWRNEPDVDVELVQSVTLATPHIAGYSALAKRNGVKQVLARLWSWAVEEGRLDTMPELPGNDASGSLIELKPGQNADCWKAAMEALPIASISQKFKQSVLASTEGNGFDQMRKDMQLRREFSEYGIAANGLSEDEQSSYHALGFQLLR